MCRCRGGCPGSGTPRSRTLLLSPRPNRSIDSRGSERRPRGLLSGAFSISSRSRAVAPARAPLAAPREAAPGPSRPLPSSGSPAQPPHRTRGACLSLPCHPQASPHPARQPAGAPLDTGGPERPRGWPGLDAAAPHPARRPQMPWGQQQGIHQGEVGSRMSSEVTEVRTAVSEELLGPRPPRQTHRPHHAGPCAQHAVNFSQAWVLRERQDRPLLVPRGCTPAEWRRDPTLRLCPAGTRGGPGLGLALHARPW